MGPRWLDKLERRFGAFSIPGLAAFLAAMSAAVGLLSLIRPDFPSQLHLDPDLLREGEVWRAVTFLFIPPQTGPLWLFFWILFMYAAMRHLEAAWGDFKFTFYWACGAAATTLAALASGLILSNVQLNMSLYLAFARLNPDYEVLLFFFFPVKMKYLARFAWVLAAWTFLAGGTGTRLATLAGIFNYMLFFGPGHWSDLKLLWHRLRNRGRFG